MRRALTVLLMLGLTLSAAAIPAQESRFAKEDDAQPGPSITRFQERRAFDFVREHHEELAGLLEPLRVMDRDEYDAAIRELFRARENLERLRRRDPERAALALESWKTNSRVELLTAHLISKPDPEKERELRRALADHLAAQLQLQKYDREQLRKRLDQLDETIRRNEGRTDAIVASRLNAVLRKVQRVRRQAEAGDRADPAPPPSGPQGDES